MSGKVEKLKFFIINGSLSATKYIVYYKKGILELPTLRFILGAVLQGVAECLHN